MTRFKYAPSMYTTDKDNELFLFLNAHFSSLAKMSTLFLFLISQLATPLSLLPNSCFHLIFLGQSKGTIEVINFWIRMYLVLFFLQKFPTNIIVSVFSCFSCLVVFVCTCVKSLCKIQFCCWDSSNLFISPSVVKTVLFKNSKN